VHHVIRRATLFHARQLYCNCVLLLQVYYCSIVEPQYENGRPLPPQPGQALKLLRMVLGKRKYSLHVKLYLAKVLIALIA
jgi:hypothetical protein